jgi:hypothetical protein
MRIQKNFVGIGQWICLQLGEQANKLPPILSSTSSTILRQQPPEGNVHLHPDGPCGNGYTEGSASRRERLPIWLRTSATDQKGIKVTLRYSGACPQGNGYHFHKPFGQEIVMVDPPNPSIETKFKFSKQDGVPEVTTYDHAQIRQSNYLDSSR